MGCLLDLPAMDVSSITMRLEEHFKHIESRFGNTPKGHDPYLI